MGAVMLMYNLIEYTDKCLKAFWILWQYCRNKPDLAADTITNFNAANANTDLFNNKSNRRRWQKKCWSNGIIKTSSRTLEIPLINCIKRVIVGTDVTDQGAKIWITDTKPYVPVLTVSTQDNVKLLEQLKSGFKKRIKKPKN